MDRRAGEVVPVHIPNLNHTRPVRLQRLPVHNLIALNRKALRRVPLELAKVIRSSGVNPNICRLARRIRETPHSARNDLGGAGIVLKVKPFDQITVLLAITDGDVLVLLGVVFVGLDEADACVASFEERTMVAATAIPVEAVDQADGHFGEGVGSDFVDVATEVTRWAVVVSADTEAGGCCGGVLGQRSTLTEKADVVWVACAVFCFGAA